MAQNINSEKGIYEMSDFEFMAYADYLSSPYYRSYMEARGQSPAINAQRNTSFNGPRKKRKVLGDYRRRKGFLILMMLCMALIIAVIAVGYIGIDAIDDYTAVYTDVKAEKSISFVDPVFGLLKKFDILKDQDSVFYDNILANLENEEDIMVKIAAYALPILSVLIVILALVVLITALAGLCKKWVGNKKYVNKKVSLVIVSLILFIFSALAVICGAIWDGAGFSGILDFVLGDSAAIAAGYGLYAIVGLSLLSFIFNLFAYSKNKMKRMPERR